MRVNTGIRNFTWSCVWSYVANQFVYFTASPECSKLISNVSLADTEGMTQVMTQIIYKLGLCPTWLKKSHLEEYGVSFRDSMMPDRCSKDSNFHRFTRFPNFSILEKVVDQCLPSNCKHHRIIPLIFQTSASLFSPLDPRIVLTLCLLVIFITEDTLVLLSLKKKGGSNRLQS